MPLAEKIASTLSAGALAQVAERQSSADVVGALAFAGRLGAELVRLRAEASHDSSAAVLILTKRLRRKNPNVAFGFARRIAGSALAEWLHGQCRTCKGSGNKLEDRGIVRPCPTCAGSGVRRFTDADRKRSLSLDGERPLPAVVVRTYDSLVGDCQTAYSNALRNVRHQLHGD
jgi:hypothetical protein